MRPISEKAGKAASAFPTFAAWCRDSPTSPSRPSIATGSSIELQLKDFSARVAQHETDHLDGVLFFDRMTSMQSLTYLDEYSKYHSKDDD